ncbi:MAG: glycerol-3-phosphate 1-O-acyltransferase PlsY [Negativibacillus sp.]|nr:glycerol-3-phosphate 1-O-acyltransferase PlsY [Negativibacillus sp.]
MTQNNLMPTIGATAITALIAYLLGSISFAIIVSKVYAHDDVRKYGSKNAGMTNILRTYGKLPAFFTLLGDFLKGVLAVVIGRWIFSTMGITAFDAGYVAGFFALLGHLYPVYFGFKGGKGVLTSLGIILVVNPLVFFILLIIFLPILFITKIVSLISITGALLYPVITLVVDLCLRKPALFDVLFAALFSVIVIYKHKDNIRRLLNGTEKRIGDKKPVTQPESRKEEKN